jgi:ABC-type Fe3+-hydroxamate transport system substrate-binding protein
LSRKLRVVSLVPSATETLLSWGSEVVACTRFCEQPQLTHVGGTKDPDLEGIVALAPDLVVVDREENRIEDYQALRDKGLAVHVLAIRSIEDLDPALSALADRLGARWEALRLAEPTAPWARALVPIWRNPWMALGQPTYGASVLARLGVSTLPANEGAYPAIKLEDPNLQPADIVIAPSEPYPFSRRQLPELEGVARTVFVDGKDLFWWGVRTVGAIERLAGVLADVRGELIA